MITMYQKSTKNRRRLTAQLEGDVQAWFSVTRSGAMAPGFILIG